MRWRIKLRIRGAGEPETAVQPIRGYSFTIAEEIEDQLWEWAGLFWADVWISTSQLDWHSERV